MSHKTSNITKVLYYLSNRASYYRSKALLDLFRADLTIELDIIVTSSLTYSEFDTTRSEILKRYGKLHTIPFNGYDGTPFSMAHYSGKLTQHIAQRLTYNVPDICVCYADRFELLPFATACAYMNIPLAQIQAGEDSGNIDQKVRHAVSHLADLRFVSHKYAEERLIGMELQNVYNTGCPSIDVIRINEIKKFDAGTNYILCIFHPHTKEIQSAKQQCEALLKAIHNFTKNNNYKCYFFASNNDPGFKEIEKSYKNYQSIEVITNLAEDAYLRLLAGAKAIIGNSSSGIREASFLGIPALNIGNRQEHRVRALNVVDCDFDNLDSAIKAIVEFKTYPSQLFGDGYASQKIYERIKEWKRQK